MPSPSSSSRSRRWSSVPRSARSSLVATGAIEGSRFVGAWAVWWAGDAMGVLAVAPFLLTIDDARSVLTSGWRAATEMGALLVALVVVCAVAFTSSLPLLFLVLPVVGWAAWRFQQAGAAPAALLVCSLAAYAAARSIGTVRSGAAARPHAHAAGVQRLGGVHLVLPRGPRGGTDGPASRPGARRRATWRIASRRGPPSSRRSQRQLAEAQEVAHIGSWSWDLATDEVQWSDEMYRIHGHDARGVPGDVPRGDGAGGRGGHGADPRHRRARAPRSPRAGPRRGVPDPSARWLGADAPGHRAASAPGTAGRCAWSASCTT